MELNEYQISEDLIILDGLRMHLGTIDSEFAKIRNDQFLVDIFKLQEGQDGVQDYIDKITAISAIITGLDDYKERLKNYRLIKEALPAEKSKYEGAIRLCGMLFKAGKDNLLEMKENLQNRIGDEKYQEGIDAYNKMAESFCSAFNSLKSYTKAFDTINQTANIQHLQ